MKSIQFPQYRRYKNHQSYFKINTHDDFEEYKLQGTNWHHYSFKVRILPDRNYLLDMLYNYESHWEKISQSEFQSFLKSISKNQG